MKARFQWHKVLCAVGLHGWVYDMSKLDMSWPEKKPTLRCCLRCGSRRERFYNGYSHGGFGGWERIRRTP